MKTLKVAVAQFQPKDGDKEYNLSVINRLTAKAKDAGAEVISFHEMSITAYTFFKDLSREQVTNLAENVPDGMSTQKLIEIATKHDMIVLAGLVELKNDQLFNTYICVDKTGLLAKFSKSIHSSANIFLPEMSMLSLILKDGNVAF